MQLGLSLFLIRKESRIMMATAWNFDENDKETQASFCRFLDDNFKLPISVYAPGCVPKVEIKERLSNLLATLKLMFD